MSDKPLQAEYRLLTEISDADALAAGELIAATWPRVERGPKERAKQLTDEGDQYSGSPEHGPRSFLVIDQQEVIAHALVFPREISVGDQSMTILALAKVAAAKHRRGEGLGAMVVKACFGLVDQGLFPHCFFQTSFAVEPFYERLGCTRVENEIVNSLNVEDPTANPFWDEIAMHYPATKPWPEGKVDLRGAGY